MNNGARPTRPSHHDYDFLKTHHKKVLMGAVAYPTFPPELNTDNGLVVPNQGIIDTEFDPPVPAMPDGCTNEAQADNATDLTGTLHNPELLEDLTHADLNGGYDIRESLTWCLPAQAKFPTRLGWIQAFYNVVAYKPLDFFDAIRLAQMSGVPEKRSISWGTPWFPSWEAACQKGIYIMPMPTDDELDMARNNANMLPWHNSAMKGWTTINGSPILKNKSWQGRGVGTGGFIGFDRPTINTVMSIAGTVAFTQTDIDAPNPEKVSLSAWQYAWSIMSDIMSTLGFRW